MTNFRQGEILTMARREGRVTVDGLAAQFDVTVQTIRRDLTDLCALGRLERVHGGAVMPSGVVNIIYEDRQSLNDDGKRAIAAAIAARIGRGASVFMNIGTTMEALALALREHADLLVVTNNLNVANILSANRSCEIVVAGGMLRRADGGLVGNFTAEMVRQFKFDHAILGCSALDADGELLDYDAQEIMVSRTAITRARHVSVAADRTKFRRTAPIAICSLAEVGTLFTDADLPPGLAETCEGWGTEIVIA